MIGNINLELHTIYYKYKIFKNSWNKKKNIQSVKVFWNRLKYKLKVTMCNLIISKLINFYIFINYKILKIKNTGSKTEM